MQINFVKSLFFAGRKDLFGGLWWLKAAKCGNANKQKITRLDRIKKNKKERFMSKKKKSPGLSSMNRAIALAINVDVNNAVKAREEIQRFRKYAESTIKDMDISSFFEMNDNSSVKRTSKELFFNCGAGETDIQTLRFLLLGFWDKERICYLVSKEALSFIDANFPPEEMNLSASGLMEVLCKQPIYLEFPPDFPLTGAFVGCSSVPDEISPSTRIHHQFFASLIYKEGAEILFSAIINASTEEFFRGTFPNESSRFLYKVIFYIGYLLSKRDSSGMALIPYPKQGCEAYEVRPITYEDWSPEYLEENGWMRTGLCSYFGYLSRKNMITDFAGRVELGSRFSDMAVTAGRSEKETMEHLQYLVLRAVLEWENYRVVYKYSKDTETLMSNRNLGEVTTKGISSDLLQYMPARTLVFLMEEAGGIAIISTCKATSGQGLLIMPIVDGHGDAVVINADSPYRIDPDKTDDQIFLQILCAVVHLLSILKENAMKKAFKDRMSQGNPDAKALVPVEFKHSILHQPSGSSPDTSPLRVGAPVGDVPLQLFNLTGKCVRRAPKAETEKFNTWKMTPHVRRRHLHHYWVGKGADRHLEARWLEPMKINNTDSDTIPTVIRNVK